MNLCLSDGQVNVVSVTSRSASRNATRLAQALEVAVYHRIEDDLVEDAIDVWAREGLAAIETYLERWAAFLTFLEQRV